MDCQVPRASRPPITGSVAYGGTKSRSRSAASRSSSLPAPSSISATPAVACGTNTCSSPSPPSVATPANSAQSLVMSLTVSRFPVWTSMICVFTCGQWL